MTEITRLEKIANNFIETELKNYHLIVYHLGIELQDYIKNIEELNDKKTGTEILREYLKIKPSDEEIDNEIINAGGFNYNQIMKKSCIECLVYFY